MSTTTSESKPITSQQPSNGATKPVAPAEPANPTVQVENQIRTMIQSNRIVLPADYSQENALKAAWLELQGVLDKDKQPALKVCSRESVVLALHSMVVMGLNPAKKQCYFVVHGKSLTLMRSYFGDIALAERVRPGIEVYAKVVRVGDKFRMSTRHGRDYVDEHECAAIGAVDEDGRLTGESVSERPILGVYAGILSPDGDDEGVVYMSRHRVEQSWKMNRYYNPKSEDSVHAKFEEDMCLRTAIRKRTGPIFRKSSDAHLLDALRKTEDAFVEGELAADISENAHAITVDFEDAQETPALTQSEEPIEAVPIGTPEPQPLLVEGESTAKKPVPEL